MSRKKLPQNGKKHRAERLVPSASTLVPSVEDFHAIGTALLHAAFLTGITEGQFLIVIEEVCKCLKARFKHFDAIEFKTHVAFLLLKSSVKLYTTKI